LGDVDVARLGVAEAENRRYYVESAAVAGIYRLLIDDKMPPLRETPIDVAMAVLKSSWTANGNDRQEKLDRWAIDRLNVEPSAGAAKIVEYWNAALGAGATDLVGIWKLQDEKQAGAALKVALDTVLTTRPMLAPVALRTAVRVSAKLLTQAENAIRNQDWPGAMEIYRNAVAADPNNPLPRMKLGLLCRDRGIWDEALEQFTGATAASPDYGAACREKGIVENKLAQIAKQPMDTNPAPGEASLRRAIEINGKDFDAFASLGGVLKRAKRFPDALNAYEQSVKVSGGHPFPLLNALKLRVPVNGHLALSGSDKLALMRAAQVREGQSKQLPAFDKPWCFFDLAEIRLYQGDAKAFLDTAMQGFAQTDNDWQGKTFVDSLRLLLPAADELPGLKEGVAELEKLLP
jgi:Flp pilus assembly protein TadD